MKLKNYQIIGLLQTLNKLDEPGDSKPKFKGNVLFALAKNHRKLKAIVEDIEKTRAALFTKYQETATQEQLQGENARLFVQEYNEVLQGTSEVTLHKIKYDDLELDKNNLPIALVSDLVEAIVED